MQPALCFHRHQFQPQRPQLRGQQASPYFLASPALTETIPSSRAGATPGDLTNRSGRARANLFMHCLGEERRGRPTPSLRRSGQTLPYRLQACQHPGSCALAPTDGTPPTPTAGPAAEPGRGRLCAAARPASYKRSCTRQPVARLRDRCRHTLLSPGPNTYLAAAASRAPAARPSRTASPPMPTRSSLLPMASADSERHVRGAGRHQPLPGRHQQPAAAVTRPLSGTAFADAAQCWCSCLFWAPPRSCSGTVKVRLAKMRCSPT